MITPIIGFLITPIGRWAVIAGVVLFAVIAIPNHYRKQGESRVKTEIKQVTNDATQKIRSAANRSNDPSVRGKLDPTTRND